MSRGPKPKHSQQPPGVVQNWSALQCGEKNTEQCGYDHAPVTRGRMRAQSPLPHGLWLNRFIAQPRPPREAARNLRDLVGAPVTRSNLPKHTQTVSLFTNSTTSKNHHRKLQSTTTMGGHLASLTPPMRHGGQHMHLLVWICSNVPG